MRSNGNSELQITPESRPGVCAVTGCVEPGDHRAPRSRRQLSDYIWLCLEHVRAYNTAWDYYAGMSENEIEAHRRADVTWRRPTWPLGARGASERVQARDPFDFLDGERDPPPTPGEPVIAGADPAERRALAVLDLRPPVSSDRVKARYKELVKRLHPDANGGDNKAEERLKLVNQAYHTLRTSPSLQPQTR